MVAFYTGTGHRQSTMANLATLLIKTMINRSILVAAIGLNFLLALAQKELANRPQCLHPIEQL